MRLTNIALWLVALILTPFFLLIFIGQPALGKYQTGKMYESQTVSFANECPFDEYSVEKRIIFDRRRYGASRVCVDREGSAREIKPIGIVLGRSNYDGSYKVSLFFDKNASERISKVLGRGHGEAVIYRGDTLLTRIVGSGQGFDGQISSYHADREEADIAMSQVASIANQEAKQSWHR